MKTRTLAILLVASLILNVVLMSETMLKASASSDEEEAAVEAVDRSLDWAAFTQALAWVESRWNDNAESPREAVGYLQITPILVDDANRICGQEEFSLEGRKDREESVRLFNVIQDEYNPDHDFHLALKIWNPYAKVSYHRAVMRKFSELRRHV